MSGVAHATVEKGGRKTLPPAAPTLSELAVGRRWGAGFPAAFLDAPAKLGGSDDVVCGLVHEVVSRISGIDVIAVCLDGPPCRLHELVFRQHVAVGQPVFGLHVSNVFGQNGIFRLLAFQGSGFSHCWFWNLDAQPI